MKFFLLLLFLSKLLIFTTLSAHADEIIPMCYWQLINQDRYIHDRNIDCSILNQLGWQGIREKRQLHMTANHDPKFLELNLINSEGSINKFHPLDNKIECRFIIRDPNGEIKQIATMPDSSDLIKLPIDDNLSGRYLLAAHIDFGKRDIDGDGTLESIHIYPKHLVPHFKDGGKVGRVSVVFFDDPQQMPFEIGPVINTAKSRFGGGMQIAHRSYEMMVKFMGKPLSKAKVNVIANGSDWHRTFITNDKGQFTIMPIDDPLVVNGWQNYLYVGTHHDRKNNDYYLTTFPVIVYKNQPEWHSKTMGFIYWAILGSCLCLLMVIGLVGRKKRDNNHSLVIFKNHKIKDKLP